MIDKKVFFLLGFIMFLTMTGYGIVLPTLPFVAEELELTSFQMGTLITAWAVAQMITAPIWGRLADRVGRKPVLMFGLFGFGIAFIILVFAQNYEQLLVVRIIGAILSSGTQPAAFSLVADYSDKKDRSVLIGKMGAVNGLGFLCGPAMGGLLSPFGLHVPFIVAGSLALFTFPLAWKYLKEPAREEGEDLKEVQPGFWESFTVITKKGYWDLYLIVLGLSLAASSFFALIGYFMIAKFEASSAFVSLAFSAQAGTSVLMQFFLLKHIYVRWNEEQIAKSGLIITTAGYCCIALAPFGWVIIFGCILTGLGQACVRPSVLSMLSKREEIGQGMTMGFQQAIDSLGRIIGPLWGGWIFLFFVSGPFLTSALIIFALYIVSVLKDRHQDLLMQKVRHKHTGM